MARLRTGQARGCPVHGRARPAPRDRRRPGSRSRRGPRVRAHGPPGEQRPPEAGIEPALLRRERAPGRVDARTRRPAPAPGGDRPTGVGRGPLCPALRHARRTGAVSLPQPVPGREEPRHALDGLGARDGRAIRRRGDGPPGAASISPGVERRRGGARRRRDVTCPRRRRSSERGPGRGLAWIVADAPTMRARVQAVEGQCRARIARISSP